MTKLSHLLVALSVLIGACLTNATITGYSNTLSSYIASAKGVTSTYSFTPLSGVDSAFNKIEITKQGFGEASSPLTATCSNLISLPSAQISTAAGKSQTATITFIISTPLESSTSGKISLTFPSGLLTASIPTANYCGITTPSSIVATTASVNAGKVVITVGTTLPAGEVIVTCSGLTFKPTAASVATVGGNTGLKIETSISSTLVAYVSTPVVGGIVANLEGALKLSKAVGNSGTATVVFSTSTAFTAHPTENKITLRFPEGLVTFQANNLCSITSSVSVKASSTFGNNAVTLTVTSDLAAGAMTVTCSGMTFAAKEAQTGSNGLRIETSQDTVAAFVNSPAVGAVTADAANSLQISQAVGQAGTATITFSISTALQPSSNNQISLTFPSGLVTSQAINLCAITTSQSEVTSAFDSNTDMITMKLAPFASLAAGQVIVTCSGLNIAARAATIATSGFTNGLKIETSQDKVAAYVSTPSIGGVTAALDALKMSTDVSTDKGSFTLTFTTSTELVGTAAKVPGNGKITLEFPNNVVATATTAADYCGVTSPSSIVVKTAATVANKIVISLTSNLPAGQVTVTCTGLAMTAKAAVTATVGGVTGLKIETSTSSTLVAHVSIPMVGGVTAAFNALTMSKAVSADKGSFTLTFTTSTELVGSAATPPGSGAINLQFPNNVVANANTNYCGVTSPSSIVVGTAAVSGAHLIVISLISNLPAGQVTVTCTGLAMTATAAVTATAANALGLQIGTTIDPLLFARVSIPMVGGVQVNHVIGKLSTLSASWSSTSNQLSITSTVDLWTDSAAPAVTCTVSSFTNAAVTAAQRRSLLQIDQVAISMFLGTNQVGSTYETGQTFPTSIASAPTRTLYLPKASSSASGVAWMFFALSALLLGL